MVFRHFAAQLVQLVETVRLRRAGCGFESPIGHHARLAELVHARVSKTRVSRFESEIEYPRLGELAHPLVLETRVSRFESEVGDHACLAVIVHALV